MNFYYSLRYSLGRGKKKLIELYDNIAWRFGLGEEIKQSKAKLEGLKDKFKGHRCFIVGNGPSLNSMNLNLMKNDYVFVSNSFYLKFEEIEFKPAFFTVEDHLVAEDNKFEIEAIRGVTKFYPIDLRQTLKFDVDTIYVNFPRAYVNPKSVSFPFFSTYALDKVFWGGTVLYMSIQLAAFMGFDEIILIGVDLTYSIPDDVMQKGSVLTSCSDDVNHFDKRYFGTGKRWHLPETDRMQKAFSTAYLNLKKNKVRLVNATLGGNLKDIPRVDFLELFDTGV